VTRTVLRDVELDGRRCDVVLGDGVILEIVARAAVSGEVVEGHGGALLPGLHDQHIHLFAAAAATRSVQLGGAPWRDVLADADRRLPPGEWLRVVGHDETFDGVLDRTTLDGCVSARPVKVQHRTGMLWILNTAALHDLGIEHPTGRLLRMDRELRAHLGDDGELPDLGEFARRLASRGVTTVTDTTPYDHPGDLAALARAVDGPEFPLAVIATGGPTLTRHRFPAPLATGPVKIVVDDHDLPPLDDAVGWVRDAHRAERSVAVHCVTRAALAYAVAMWDVAGGRHGDRVEHGAVVPPDLAGSLARLGIAVVTQPSLVAARGDRYLAEVDPDDLPHLWPCGSLLRAGVRVAGGSDAPYGDPDPWRSIAAAVERRTASGAVQGAAERVTADAALGLWLQQPDGSPRRVVVGAPADLCLLDRPLPVALADPADVVVVGTWRSGLRTHGRPVT